MVAEAGRLAALLARQRNRAGDRVVIQLPNCVEFATLTLACLEVGAIPVMALPAFRRAELEYLLSFSDAKAIAIAPEYRGFDHAALARELKVTHVSSFDRAGRRMRLDAQLGDHIAPIGSSTGDPFDVALFLLSGGTTGMPKLIPRTHADFLYNAREAGRGFADSPPESRMLIALPAEHNFPLACPGLLGALLTGARTTFTPVDEGARSRGHNRARADHSPALRADDRDLLAQSSGVVRAKLASLRVITVGGQTAPGAYGTRAQARLSACQRAAGVRHGRRTAVLYPARRLRRGFAFTTQGRPLSPADEIRIVDTDGIRCRAGRSASCGAAGRTRFAVTSVRPIAIARPSLPTDSIAPATSCGSIRRAISWSKDRIKDLINRGGEKINAEEIEAHLIAHPAVSAAAVVAMPDAMLGEKACAYLCCATEPRSTLAAMREFLAARGVARFKWPERIEIVRELPLHQRRQDQEIGTADRHRARNSPPNARRRLPDSTPSQGN